MAQAPALKLGAGMAKHATKRQKSSDPEQTALTEGAILTRSAIQIYMVVTFYSPAITAAANTSAI